MAGMSFNATTSKLEHTTGAGLTGASFTLLAHVRADGLGENSFGRIIQADETSTAGINAGNGWVFIHADSTNTLRFQHSFNPTSGVWHFPATDSAWHAVSLTYDRSLVTNDPVARVDYAAVTVTEIATPTLTATAAGTGYCIGNRTGQDRTWNGGLCCIQFHPGVLTAANQDKANRNPGSVRTDGAIWWPLRHGTDVAAKTVSGGIWTAYASTPTATACTTYATSSPRMGLAPLIRAA